MENSSKWEPVAGFAVGQRVQHLQYAAAPRPHTSPFSCKLLLTTVSMPEGSEQSTVAERGCGNIQVKDRKAIAGEWAAKGRRWLPQEEHLRKLQAGKSANASQWKTSPDPLQAECKRLL